MTIDLELKIEDALFRIKDLYDKTNAKCCLAFSGGKDTTILAELIFMAQKKYNLPEIPFVFADTQVEYDATYKFIDWFSKNKYPIEILKPIKPFGKILKEYGLPFASKIKSEFINSYQKNKYYEYYLNKNYNNLEEKLQHINKGVGELVTGNMCKKLNKEDNIYYELRQELLTLAKEKNIKIDNNLVLLILNGRTTSKERLANRHMHVLHPQHEYKISSRCCYYLKKQPFYNYYAENEILGYFTGIRISEGGVRAIQYKTCTSTKKIGNVTLWHKMPIFDWTDDNINEFIKVFNIKISDVYTVYNLERSGCVGCPFSKQLEKNLKALYMYEPIKYKAIKKWLENVYMDMEIELPFDKEYMFNLEQRKKIINKRRYEMLMLFRTEVANKYKKEYIQLKLF